MSEIFQEIVRQRGIDTEFLKPCYEKCIDPFLLPDMAAAMEAIAEAKRAGAKVLIYGDYDVDGVTASTVMHDTLKLAGIDDVEVMLPNRFTDGYGMGEKVVKRAAEIGAGLVVTVDCGSGNHEIIARLKEGGVPVVVTDHHECGEELPEARAVVNAKRKDYTGPEELRELAGVGVAFKVAQALVEKGMIKAGQEKWLLDLVAIGTICDSMRLIGENRRLVYYGLKVLAQTRRPGLRELMAVSGVKKLDTEAIGFQLGPRLNAAGRMETAEKALELLMATDRVEAAARAAELQELNMARKEQQVAAVREIAERGVPEEPVIVVSGEWSEGVIGIVAGKLVEEYKRPAFVLTRVEEGCLKGSGRSFGEFNLAEALEACRECLQGGGGHAQACGVSLAESRLEEFRRAVNEYYRGLGLTEQEKFLELREDLAVEEFGEFSLELVEELQQLEPYGDGNPEPVFLLPEVMVLEAAKLGAEQKHLRLLVRDNAGRTLKLMCFYAPEEYMGLRGGERVDVWVTVCENEFRGIRSVEGRIVRMKI